MCDDHFKRIARSGLIAAPVLLWLLTQPAGAAWGDYCANTANALFVACMNENRDDYWVATAKCINVTDGGERLECRGDARGELAEAREECRDQRDARLEVCDAVGDERYDPDWEPEDFETDFANLNPYRPLAPGNMWVFESGDETDTVQVLDKTKLIEGVTCIVIHDVVEVDGSTVEDTLDWEAQASNGDVHYCGEVALNLESFDGDNPVEPEVVDIEGSWKAGRDGAKPGVLFFAAPQVGVTYRQEVAWGDAEDVAEVLSNDYRYGDDPDLDELVPQELAELLCDGDCVVTREFTPLDPDVEEFKYYAPGLGVFLEVNREEREVVQLVSCNVDVRCAALPVP